LVPVNVSTYVTVPWGTAVPPVTVDVTVAENVTGSLTIEAAGRADTVTLVADTITVCGVVTARLERKFGSVEMY
jgi:hypothetical protein